MKRIRRTPRGNRCDKSQDSQGILLFVLKRGKIAIFRQPLIYNTSRFGSISKSSKVQLYIIIMKPFIEVAGGNHLPAICYIQKEV